MIRRAGRKPRQSADRHEHIGLVAAIPALGLDALASAAYGPEAALTVLLAAGFRATPIVVPITLAIVGVLLLVYISYLQTISAYPDGGGAYTVAKENLGARWGVLAAVALCTDYILNVAVAIAAGVGALVSAAPPLLPYTLPLCLAILALLTFVNLRGVKTAGLSFVAPTYAYVGCLAAVIVIGLIRLAIGRTGTPAVQAGEAVTIWLVLRAFASGCTALTGVEAVSNAVPLFREPKQVLARRTLTVIVLILATLIVGVSLLTRGFGLIATPPGRPGYQTLLSQVTAAVFGRSAMYFVTMIATLAVLCLSANTSFADFPRVCRLLARDDYLPHAFAERSAGLVYPEGVVVLAALSGALLVMFGGVTDALIPLFAVGAFSAFTLSQIGMTVHWRKRRASLRHALTNGVGAVATSTALAIIIVTKFTEGAWLTALVIPAGYAGLTYRRHRSKHTHHR